MGSLRRVRLGEIYLQAQSHAGGRHCQEALEMYLLSAQQEQAEDDVSG